MSALIRRGALATGVTTSALLAVAQHVRRMGKVAYPMQPFYKKQIRAKRPGRNLKRRWPSFNDPKLMPKFLRHAERVARQLGVVEDVASFDEAARAFANPPPLVAATLLERGNVVMRDLEEWETNFLTLKWEREQVLGKLYPEALIDQWTAGDKVMETDRADSGGKDKRPKGGAKDAAGGAGSADGAEGQAAAAAVEEATAAKTRAKQANVALSDFYEKTDMQMSNSSDGAKGLAIAPRESSADTIGDMRSLERAYSQRLALLVRDKGTGRWSLPSGVRMEGEPMRQAAERSLRALFGDAALLAWYVGGAPVGHLLRVYSPAEQAALSCYGEKVFIYRAEIVKGRFRLPKEGETGPRAPSVFPYDDFMWLSRDEMEGVMGSGGDGGRATWKYLHQVVGLGAGEEATRAQAWKDRCAKRGVTLAEASGRRAERVRKQLRLGFRLPAIASRGAAELSARVWDAQGGKAADVKDASTAYYARVRDCRARSEQLRQQLSTPSKQKLIAAQMAVQGRGVEPPLPARVMA